MIFQDYEELREEAYEHWLEERSARNNVCKCNTASEEPCEFCSEDHDDEEEE